MRASAFSCSVLCANINYFSSPATVVNLDFESLFRLDVFMRHKYREISWKDSSKFPGEKRLFFAQVSLKSSFV